MNDPRLKQSAEGHSFWSRRIVAFLQSSSGPSQCGLYLLNKSSDFFLVWWVWDISQILLEGLFCILVLSLDEINLAQHQLSPAHLSAAELIRNQQFTLSIRQLAE